ncbi:MAG: RNA polymerase sigma factor RpoD/SigA [Nanoarchaeota archaeon]
MGKHSNPRINGTENGRDLVESYSSLSMYFSRIRNTKPLSRKEEIELAKLIKHGDLEAREKLILANLRFVVKIAKEYTPDGKLLEELIAESNVGIIEAAKRYDETRGFKFITYAVWWIRQSILKYLAEHGRTIDLPIKTQDDRRKVEEAIGKLDSKYGMHIDPLSHLEEISTLTEVKENKIEPLFIYYHKQPSLDAEVDNEVENPGLYSVIPDKTEASPEENLMKNELKENLRKSLDGIPNMEARVLRLYYGIGRDDREYTLEEIGTQLGKTRERIRQIRNKALERLRQPSRAKTLREYV